jgi:hypothetical protein
MKRFEPTKEDRRLVESMAAYGVVQDDIARVIGVSLATLRRHFREELATGAIRANVRVANNLFRIACGNGREAVTAAIFWMKCRARWSTVHAPEDTEGATAPMGKKAAARAAAEDTLENGSDDDWGDDLNPYVVN